MYSIMLFVRNALRCSLIVVMLQLALPAIAQRCPSSRVNERELESELVKIGIEDTNYFPNDPDISGPRFDTDQIYRLSAIGGSGLVPALRRLSKPGMSFNSVAGAAQISLAKLGDADAFRQILRELNQGGNSTRDGSGEPVQALYKLGRIGSDQAAAALIDYYLSHISESSKGSVPISAVDEGVTPSDWLLGGLKILEPYLSDPPRIKSGAQQWTEWCQNNKTGQVTWIIDRQDSFTPRQACLVRKIRWGFWDAILDLASDNDKRLIPVLKELAQVGYANTRTSPLDRTLRGRAQTALAKLGDEDEFEAILRELDSQNYSFAFPKLEFIGGKRAAQAFTDALESNSFLAGQRLPEWRISEERTKRNELILTELNKIVSIPTELTGKFKDKKNWIAWWEKNKKTARFVDSTNVKRE